MNTYSVQMKKLPNCCQRCCFFFLFQLCCHYESWIKNITLNQNFIMDKKFTLFSKEPKNHGALGHGIVGLCHAALNQKQKSSARLENRNLIQRDETKRRYQSTKQSIFRLGNFGEQSIFRTPTSAVQTLSLETNLFLVFSYLN